MNTKTKKAALTIIRLVRDAERDQAVLHRCGRTQVELDADFEEALAAVAELIAASTDFLHVESCAYNAMAIVEPRNRLRAALARVGGAL